MAKVLMIFVVILVLVGGGYFLLNQNAMAPVYYATPTPIVYSSPAPSGSPPAIIGSSKSISLVEQNNSGESGKATFVEKDGKVEVTLSLTGAPVGVSQPAHIHKGTCAQIGGVVYPLTFPVDGKSTTTLDVTLSQLKEQSPLALNVHKSGPESSVYVACGDLAL